MVNSDNVLLDDGPLIQVLGDEVRCCSNELDTSGMSLGVGVCAFKAGQE